MVELAALHISSERPQELGAFYQKVLGTAPEWQNEGGMSFTMGNVRLLILAHDHIRGKNSSPERLFFDLQVGDVESEFTRIVALGASVVQQPYQFDDGEMTLMIATLADPDGNYFQLLSMAPA